MFLQVMGVALKNLVIVLAVFMFIFYYFFLLLFSRLIRMDGKGSRSRCLGGDIEMELGICILDTFLVGCCCFVFADA